VVSGVGPRVLFLTPRSWAAHVQWDAMVARALAARGAHVSFLTCGGGRGACDRVHLYEGPPMPCRTCTSYTHQSLDAHGHSFTPLRPAGDIHDPAWPELDELDLAGLRATVRSNLPLGELVEIPVRWFLCNTDLERDPLARLTYRRFLRSAAGIVDELTTALERERPETVVMLNGLFLFEQLARELCGRAGIEVVTYERGYVKDTVFFSRATTASRYDTTALWAEARQHPLTATQDAALDDYLTARRTGDRSISDFWPAPRFEDAVPGFAVMFTNVSWDTAVQGRDRCFADFRTWIIDVIRWFEDRPEQRLVIRAHPAEVRSPKAESREPVVTIISDQISRLPDNVRVIAPEDPTSSYPLMEAADVALVYTSTAGLEAVLQGTPCITAASTQFGSKGFTLDPGDRTEYFDLLSGVLKEPAAHAPDIGLARRYAHFFFFEAALSSEAWMWEPIPGLARITDDPQVVAPGGDADLDAICRGILDGAPFLRPTS
jgi:hypothetical protein